MRPPHFAEQLYFIIFNIPRRINTGGSHITSSFSHTEGNSLLPAQFFSFFLAHSWAELLSPPSLVLLSTKFPPLFKEFVLFPLNRKTSCLVKSVEVSLENYRNRMDLPDYLFVLLLYCHLFQKCSAMQPGQQSSALSTAEGRK